MRRRYVYDPQTKEMVEIDVNARTEQRAPMVIPDLPDYVSPVTGRLVSGRRQRREDLLRTNSRPWEGMESERRESARQIRYADEKREQRVEHTARTLYHQKLTPAQRREIEGR